MIARVLQWIGGLTLLAVGAAGAAALALVKDRIAVTIHEPDSSPAPDPLAVVRDDLQQLRLDLTAIASALEANFAHVGSELAGAAQRDAALRIEVAQRDAASGKDQAQRHAALRADLAQLAAAVAAMPTHASAPVAAVTPDAPPSPAAPPVEPVPELVPAPEVEPETAPTPGIAEAPAARGFLSFALPSNALTFDRPQHYRVLPSLSRVGFDAKSTLHDFSGATSKVEGDVHANLADPAAGWHGEIACDATALATGVEGRDAGMREHLDTDHHPRIRFEVTGFRATEGGIDVAAGSARGTVTGRMSIHGQTREVEMPIEISTDASRRIAVSGQLPLKLTDYGIAVPNKLGLVSMEDQVTVWIALRARSVGDAEERTREH